MSKIKWVMDPAHSEIVFKVRHMMITNVSGTFNEFEGTMLASESDFSDAEISFEASLASVNTRNEQRDGHLVSPDFFDVENYPKLSFQSTSFVKKQNNEYIMKGNMTLHGITKEIELEVEYTGTAIDPWGQVKSGFEIFGSLNRFDYELNWNAKAEDGTVVLDQTIKIAINAQLVKQL